MPELSIYLFGSPRLEVDGDSVAMNRRKVMALLTYLVLTRHAHRRDHLAALFWPGYDQTTARGNLRRALSTLNRTVDGPWLQIDREQVSIRRDDGLCVDVDQFHHHLTSCSYHGHAVSEVCDECLEPLRQAAALYRDDLLTGFTLPDSPQFDDWQLLQTESLRRELTEVLEKLIRVLSNKGQLEPAIAFARRWLTVDPLQESAHRYLMRLLAYSGERNAALAQYESCRQVLSDELGLEPTAETTGLYEQIRAAKLAGEAPAFEAQMFPPDLASARPAAPRHNLPDAVTPFVGRAEEVREISRLLDDEPTCRLLTLVGPGGIGKTRLALQAASQVIDAFPDGTYFVPLATVSTVEPFILAITEALSLPLHGGTTRDNLIGHLRQKEMLLVLDNFEQLIPAGATDLLSEITRTAPGVKLLVTSRERLNLQAEWGVDVGGLRFPSGGASHEWDGQEVETFDAVRLFRQDAQRARPGFALSSTDLPHVVRICQMVEGMPLGIELAAAWLRMMSCEEIVEEIESGLDFLTSSVRDVPERHRSLRNVFEQSWGLLPDEERAALRKLSVFRGGFQRRAAERVAGTPLSMLSDLVDKSFLRRNRSGRYDVHELLRQYAAEKLHEVAGESDQAEDRHAEYYLTFVAQRTDDLKGRRQNEAVAEITAEIDNVRAAWYRAVTNGDASALGKSAYGLLHFSSIRGWFQEGATLFEQALQRLGAESDQEGPGERTEAEKIVLAQLQAGKGWFQGRLGSIGPGQELLERSVTVLAEAEPRSWPELAFSLFIIGELSFFRGQYSQMERYAEHLLSISREMDDQWGIGTAMWYLGGSATYQGEYLRAAQFLEESATALAQAGERQGLVLNAIFQSIVSRMQGQYEQSARILDGAHAYELVVVRGYFARERGYLALSLGDYCLATEQMQESLAVFRDVGLRHAVVFPLDGLGSIARLTGEHKQAQRLHEESLAICREVGEDRGIALNLSNLGRLAYDQQEFSEAEQLQRQSLAAFEQLGHKQGMATALCNLGYATCALGEPRLAEADQFFRRSLELATQIGAVPVALDALAGYARLLCADQAGEAERSQAAVLFALVQGHPASEQETREKASREMGELASSLSAAVLARAQERGDAMSLDTAVHEILGHGEVGPV